MPRDTDDLTGAMMAGPEPQKAGTWTTDHAVRWVRPLVYLGCAAVFTADMVTDVSLFFGLFYIPLVCTAVFHRDPDSAWWLAGIAIVMIVLGFFFPVINAHVVTAIANRALSIAAILITAVLVRHTRLIHDRLAEQTRRTKRAEEVKTLLLTSLGSEIRNPLHAMIGLTELLIAGAEAGQRPPLRQIQDSSHRLLSAVETLIDVTQIEDRHFQSEPVDVAAIPPLVAAAWHRRGTDRQIQVVCSGLEGAKVMSHTDAWAVRRILELLTAIAADAARPGTSIVLGAQALLAQQEAAVTVHFSSADRLKSVLSPLRGDPSYQGTDDAMTATGIGVLLCQRLIAVTGTVLTVDDSTGPSVTLTLRLPA